MSNFVDQSLLIKETDNDTYMLFSLIQENNNIILDSNNEKNNNIIKKIKQLLLGKEDMVNIDYTKFDIEDIENDVDLIDTFVDDIYTVDFTNTLQELIVNGDSNTDLNTIFSSKNHIYYGLFSLNNILNYFRYWVYNLFIKEEHNEVLYAYGFTTISKGFQPNTQLFILKDNTAVWTPTDYFLIQNMYESTKISDKRICFVILNLLVNDNYYSEYPLLFVLRQNHTGNETCYIENKFKVLKDIISNTESVNKHVVCYNKYPVKIIEKKSDALDEESYIAPSNSYRFAFISHGKIDVNVDEIENRNNYKQYIYPFKNIQYFVQPNCTLSLGSDIDGREQTMMSVCYDNVSSLQPEIPINNKLTTLPMIFYGPRESDPSTRAESFGLYDCQSRTKIKLNNEIFGLNNERQREFDYIFKVVFNYCLNNNIPFEDVEIKIFACRTCCTKTNIQSMTIEGGENRKINDTVSSASNFESVNQTNFFKYLIKDAISCDYPKKGGKKKVKVTRRSKKKTKKNKTRKHKNVHKYK